MAVAETIKPSSSRKHLAASFRLVRRDRRGPLARQQRQHACLSECAIAQSIALRCQITLEWTAATSASTLSVRHDATISVSHSVWNTDPERETERVGVEGGREEEQRSKERRKSRPERGDSHLCCFMQRTVMTRSFYPYTHPTRANIECITTSLRNKIPQPSSATLDKYPRPLSVT